MVRSLLMILAAAILLASLLAGAQLASAQSDNPAGESLKWIALGDSYSAGVGSNANPTRNFCARQQDAYPIKAMEILELQGWEFWSDRIPGPFRSEWHHACIGAVTDDHYNQQDAGVYFGVDLSRWNAQPQRDHLDEDTQIVTLTMGGNDLGFADIIEDCLLASCDGFDPVNEDRYGEHSSFQEVEIALAGMYIDIADRIDNSGHIFVLGYPELFADPILWRDNNSSCEGFTPADARNANHGLQRLNDAIRGAIETANRRIPELGHGAEVHFVDIQDDFAGKSLCAGGVESYIRGLSPQTTGTAGLATDSYHPSSIGYGVMARELASCMEDVILRGDPCDEAAPDGPIFDGTSTSTVMVVDVSSSMQDPSPVGPAVPKIDAAIDAAQALTSVVEIDVDQGAQHSVGLVAFSDSAEVITPSTTDLDRASSAAVGLRADGDTDIGDGLSRGIQTVLDNAELKRIVLLSDGEITDGLSQDEVLSRIVPGAVARDITIDVIGFAQPGSLDESFLQSIASATGGNLSLAETAEDLRAQFVRTRHEATGTVVVDLVGRLDPDSDAAIADFDVPPDTSQLVVTLGYESVGTVDPVLLDSFGRAIPTAQLRVVGSNPVTVAVNNPVPGTWSVHVNEPEESVADNRALWRPPVDGTQAGALSQQSSAGGDVPFLLVVSTRSGPNPDVAVGLTRRSSLPWLAAGQLAAVSALLVGGLATVGASAAGLAGSGGTADRSAEQAGRRRRLLWLLPTGGLAAVLFLGVGVLVGGFGG